MMYPENVITSGDRLKYDLFMENFENFTLEGLEMLKTLTPDDVQSYTEEGVSIYELIDYYKCHECENDDDI